MRGGDYLLLLTIASCTVLGGLVGYRIGLEENTLHHRQVTHGECMGCGAKTVITISEYK